MGLARTSNRFLTISATSGGSAWVKISAHILLAASGGPTLPPTVSHLLSITHERSRTWVSVIIWFTRSHSTLHQLLRRQFSTWIYHLPQHTSWEAFQILRSGDNKLLSLASLPFILLPACLSSFYKMSFSLLSFPRGCIHLQKHPQHVSNNIHTHTDVTIEVAWTNLIAQQNGLVHN